MVGKIGLTASGATQPKPRISAQRLLFGHERQPHPEAPVLNPKPPATKPTFGSKVRSFMEKLVAAIPMFKKSTPPTLDQLYKEVRACHTALPMKPADEMVPKAVKILKGAIALAPNSPENRLKVADFYSTFAYYRQEAEGVNLKQEAIGHYQKALELGFQDYSGKVQRNIGKLHERAGNIPAAIEIRQQLAEKFPTESALHQELGEVLLKDGRVDDAMRAYQKAETHFPESGASHTRYQIKRALEILQDIKKGLRNYTGQYTRKPSY